MASAAGAIAARMQGDDFQARWFLIEAMRLFDDKSHVVRVALEQKHLFPWFDDVVTFYGQQARVHRWIDAHQVKFHIVADGALSFDTMMDPQFIGSASTSLVQRVVDVHRKRGGDCDLVLASPWTVHPDDLLASMAEIGRDGRLRLDALFDGKRKSNAAQIRRELSVHSQSGEDELRDALERLRIVPTQGLTMIMALLDAHLARHGYATVGDAAFANSYDDLVRKIIQGGGEMEFDRASMATLLHRAGLVAVAEPKRRHRVGIRSFIRHAEHLDDYADDLLDVRDAFNGRYMKESSSWNDLRDRVVAFMTRVDDARHEEIELYVPCHNSIAFTAGRAVSPKSATRYFVHQPGAHGSLVWDLTERADLSDGDLWTVTEICIREGAPDVAIAVGLAHNITDDVKRYVEGNVPSVGVVLGFQPVNGCGQTSVRNGAHVVALADALDALLAQRRTIEQRRAMLHAFISGPNGFAFAFGRGARRVAKTTIYEWDFERKDPEGYSPGVVFAP